MIATQLPDWLLPGKHVYVDTRKTRGHRVSEALLACWLEVIAVEGQSAIVRRYRPGADKGWCVGEEPVTWVVPSAVLLPRPPRPGQNKAGFAVSAVTADHLEKDPEDIEF